ncbi:MAG: hemin ABC transporter substrate-binding protein [Longimonas sp.]|uniref:heme/hemin ABC transporter substrate-binding protein n=1 Tax=Longimonas sp. TaxID=2039626 RepID=UPI003975EF49
MHRIPLFLLSTALLLLGSAPTASAQDTEAERVLPLGGSVTEIVYALDQGDRVVGVDASSIYPEAATEKPDVGYYRQLSAEGVLSLDPDIILALEGTGPPAVLDQLRNADVGVETIPDEPSVAGAKQKIRQVAELLGRVDAGDDLVAEMERQLAEARTLREEADTPPRVLFIYARGSGTMNVAGSGTSAGAMIELAGGENALTGIDGFKPLTAEAVVDAAPDVILMLTRGLDSVGGVEGVLEQPGIELTPAGENRRIVAMDDLLLLGFGPRLGTAVRELTGELHPELEAASISAE